MRRPLPRFAAFGFAVLLSACGGSDANPGAAVASATFPIPQCIDVSVAPYPSVDAALTDAQSVDWLHDGPRARAVTLAYAARELQNHLSLAGLKVAVASPGACGSSGVVLATSDESANPLRPSLSELNVNYSALGDQGYAIVPYQASIYITGNTRASVLNGVYRLLGHLGFAWYDPSETVIPNAAPFQVPTKWPRIVEIPRVRMRGFWIFGTAPIPDSYAIWLARNRFNIGGTAKPYLQHELGLIGWGGGHELLQQEFSRPGLFDQHPDWYGMRNGVRQPVPASGPYYNIAFVNADAANYFADQMIQRLESGDLQSIDVLNIWPVDSRFNSFDQSPEALALGNESDNLLKFYAVVQNAFDAAHKDGRLSRPVTVAGISYFLTMQPPTNHAVTDALANTHYLHIFYPIDRDWSDYFDANLANRYANRHLSQDMVGWQDFGTLNFGVVEYYNLGNYAALGLTDYPMLSVNYQKLTDRSRSLYAYMHPLLSNPGPRRLTNSLLSQLGWQDADGTQDGLTQLQDRGAQAVDDYFARRYGEHFSDWRKVYELMSESVDNAKELFGTDSLYWVLLQRYFWTTPPYSDAEAASFIQKYRSGGAQDLPGGYSSVPVIRETFRGLDDSIRLQQQAEATWTAILKLDLPTDVRNRMASDVEWFEATNSRYRLMAATCDYVVAQQQHADVSDARARIARETAFLEASPVTQDTISPVDQRAFISLHRKLAGL